MGTYAQRQHRGGGPAQATAIPAPVLTAVDPENVSWTWTPPDPDHWSLEASATGLAPWSEEQTPAGNDRTQGSLSPDTFYRIRGMDALSTPTTPFSNIVQTPP